MPFSDLVPQVAGSVSSSSCLKMCPLHADANQSQGGDMKRKSHWTITAQETDRRHILASWPQPPTDSSAWLTDVMRYEGGRGCCSLASFLKKQTKRGHKRVYLRYEWQWFNLTVFSNKPGMRTRRREWRGHLFLFCLFSFLLFVNMFTYDWPWSLWNECERGDGTDESSSTLHNIICI